MFVISKLFWRKSLILGFFLSLFSLPLTQSWADDINYMVIESQAGPLQILEGGKHKGVFTDVVTEIFKDSPHKVKMHAFPFMRMVQSLNHKEYPNWVNFGTPSWGKPQGENLTKTSILTVNHSLLVLKSSTFRPKTIADLQGKVVIILKGFNYPGLEEHLKDGKIKVVEAKDYEAAFAVLERSPNDSCFIEMEMRIKYNLKQNKRPYDQYEFMDFSQTVKNYDLFLSLDPEMPKELQTFINDRLTKIKEEGFIEKSLAQYL